MGDTFFSPTEEVLNAMSKSKTGMLIAISVDNYCAIECAVGNHACNLLMQNLVMFLSLKPEIKYVTRRISSMVLVTQPINLNALRRDIMEWSVSSGYDGVYLDSKIASINFDEKQRPYDVFNNTILALATVSNRFRIITEKDYLAFQEDSKHTMRHASVISKALICEDIRLVYQPVVCSKKEEVRFYEALLRLNCGSQCTTGNLVSSAESLGFMDMVDVLIYNKVIEILISYPELVISVNISSSGIQSEAWRNTLFEKLKNSSVASRLIIEITETWMNFDYVTMGNFIDKLKSLGCMVAIDDFGSGYTSVLELISLNIDIIKIGGQIIKEIRTNSKAKPIIRSIIRGCKDIGVKVVAEFISDMELASIMRELGVDYLQGDYAGKSITLPLTRADT